MQSLKSLFIFLLLTCLFVLIISYGYKNLINQPFLLLTKASNKAKTTKQEEQNSNTIVDSYIKNAHIVSYKAAFPKFSLTSQYIMHYSGKTESVALDPFLKVITFNAPFTTTTKPSSNNFLNNEKINVTFWTAKSEHAWLSADTSRIRMEKNVVIVKRDKQTQSFSQLETSLLWIWPKKELAESDKYVKIINNEVLITSVGLTANLKTTQYHLLNDVHVKIKQ